MPLIFLGNERFAYRDPACYYHEGCYHLFFTVSEKQDGYMYNYVGYSRSEDLCNFTEPRLITEKDYTKNFCSPGNVLKFGDQYLICVCSYPMPVPYVERSYADDSARLFFIKTKDFCKFSAPERIYPKGKSIANEGRMIDPFVLEADGEYRLFFKQNGIGLSRSHDLCNWEFLGHAEGGENACVLPYGDEYLLLHSPDNGIGIKHSNDLCHWTDEGVYTLDQEHWDFASGRLTAAFAMPTEGRSEYKYIVFFHGSVADSYPETHGEASLALVYTNDFKEFHF